MLLGCIADDFTGATDLASTLVRGGMGTIQVIGVPQDGFDCSDAEAVVVALKSRTIAPAEAVAQSLAALDWLKRGGARQIFFKYCSTFDSTDDGNIGPVADALLDALESDFTIACPAFPANGRRVFQGHLFVGRQLLSESGMKDHPLTPMRDADLVRVLGRQTARGVGLVAHEVVAAGADAIKSSCCELAASGFGYAIVDAVSESDLLAIGQACDDLALVTGGSGVALGLPDNFRRLGLLATDAGAPLPEIRGRQAVLAGSCSLATRAQVSRAQRDWPSFAIDPLALAAGRQDATAALDWAAEQDVGRPLLFTSSADPQVVARTQEELGRDRAGRLVEEAHGQIAAGLVELGFRQLVVAGGETAGAVVQALEVPALRIGRDIDPGVPWTESLGGQRLALALKSGNFGGEDFFIRAFEMLR